MRSILVAGRTGQLARAMLKLGNERKLPIITAGRPELDLSDRASVDRVVEACRPRAIVNAAAYTLVDKAESEPDLAFKVNRDGAAHLAQLAERLHVPFIHVSTDYVFDGNKPTPYKEEDIPSPLNIYGRSKREGEIAVLDSCAAAAVVRTSWIYGPYGQNFVKTMLRLAETRNHIQVVDDQYGSPTSAQDLAQAVLEIVEQIEADPDRNRGGIYHLTAAGETTWYGLAVAIFEGWAKRGKRIPALEAITTANFPTPARRPRNSRLDCSKAARVFGTRLPPWRHALETCLDELATGQVSIQPC
jgi:dTDP-4-dehydrorhamnose reductase